MKLYKVDRVGETVEEGHLRWVIVRAVNKKHALHVVDDIVRDKYPIGAWCKKGTRLSVARLKTKGVPAIIDHGTNKRG